MSRFEDKLPETDVAMLRRIRKVYEMNPDSVMSDADFHAVLQIMSMPILRASIAAGNRFAWIAAHTRLCRLTTDQISELTSVLIARTDPQESPVSGQCVAVYGVATHHRIDDERLVTRAMAHLSIGSDLVSTAARVYLSSIRQLSDGLATAQIAKRVGHELVQTASRALSNEIGRRVKTFREMLGISVEQFAAMVSEAGVSLSIDQASMIEAGAIVTIDLELMVAMVFLAVLSIDDAIGVCLHDAGASHDSGTPPE